jgi:NAD(P)-dependent dehydrogenase (short-subunit alcohol dehydrogenase family)
VPGFIGLAGRSVLVTGAAGGIAKAIALRLGEERAVVGALDRDEAGAADRRARSRARRPRVTCAPTSGRRGGRARDGRVRTGGRDQRSS